MVAVFLSVLFAGAFVLAGAVIVDSWRRYGPQMAAMRRELAQLRATRDFRYTVREIQVRTAVPVLRPRSVRPVARPVAAYGLRAAA